MPIISEIVHNGWRTEVTFKLRNLNVYYNFPSSWAKKVKMEKIQVYARANNLFSLDHVKYMNCEDLKINYPDMTSVYFGLNINF